MGLSLIKKTLCELLKFIAICTLFFLVMLYGLRIECDIANGLHSFVGTNHNTTGNIFQPAFYSMYICPNVLQVISNYLIITIIFFVLSYKNKISSSWYKEWLLIPLLLILLGGILGQEITGYSIKDMRLIYSFYSLLLIVISLLFGIKKTWRKTSFSFVKWILILLVLIIGEDCYLQNKEKDFYYPGPNCMNTDQIESEKTISENEINGYTFYDFSDIHINNKIISFKLNEDIKEIDISENLQTYQYEPLKALPIWSETNEYGEYKIFIGKTQEGNIILAVGERKSGDCSYYISFKTLTILMKNHTVLQGVEEPNQHIVEQDNLSKIIMEKNGKFYPCDDPDNDFTEKECNKCPELRKFENGSCIFIKSPYPDRPLMSLSAIGYKDRLVQKGTVFDECDRDWSIKTTAENCALCPNRRYENGKCFLNDCPEGYFSGYQGSCYKCSDTQVHGIFSYTTKENCAKCPERELKNGECILKVCPADQPVRSDGRCLPCDWPFQLEPGTNEASECSKCPNLEYVNGKCVKKQNDKELIAIEEQKETYTNNIAETDKEKLSFEEKPQKNTQVKDVAKIPSKVQAQPNNVENERDNRVFYVENLDQAKRLLKKKLDLNIKDENGETVLTNAIKKHSDLELIQFFVEKGADISLRNSDNKDAFIVAYETGTNLELMDFLIQKGAIVEKNYLTAYKMIKDCSEESDWYMEYSAQGQPLNCRPCSTEKSLGYTTEKDCLKCPNHIRLKNAKVVDQCLSCDKDFTVLSAWDDGSFHNVCTKWVPDEQTGYYKLPQCPIETPIWGKSRNSKIPECFKCDYKYRTNPYKNDTETVIRTSKLECDKCPLRKFYYGDVFYHGNAIQHNYAGLEQTNSPYEGICVISNTQQPYFEIEGKSYHCRGYQPIKTTKENCDKCGEWRRMENGMCILAKYNAEWKEEKMEDLINYTADLSKKLDFSVIQSFISNGADINMRQLGTGLTPLMFIVQHHDFTTPDIEEILKWTLQMGADVNAQDNEGNTPLIWCLKNSCSQNFIKILVEKGAKINQGNSEGKTALLWAVQDDDLQTVKLLISLGADPLQKNKKGINAVERAQSNPSRFVKEYLNEYVKQGIQE